VHVTDQANGKGVNVRINDRGPFVEGRIIDLSYAAAQSISMPSIATVQLSVVSTPKTRAIQSYAVQVGSFAQKADATALLQRLSASHGEGKLVYRQGDQTWRVLVGRLPTIDAANALARQIEPEAGPAFVVLLDEEG
jgi:rare lipoprotein A